MTSIPFRSPYGLHGGPNNNEQTVDMHAKEAREGTRAPHEGSSNRGG